MDNQIKPLARYNSLVVLDLPDEVLVYDLAKNKGHCLNQSAALIWKSCDGCSSIQDIVRRFESSGTGRVNEDFVWLAIDQLIENDLLDSPIVPRFAGQTRREVFKRMGMVSVAVAPIIATLLTPRNALASVSACLCFSNAQCLAPQCRPNTRCDLTIGICVP